LELILLNRFGDNYSGKPSAHKRSAFTLVELVIVLMIMGVLAAVAAPKYISSLSRFRVEAAARRIAADLNYVRGRAMMKGPSQEEWVTFYPLTEQYEMHDDPDLDHPEAEYWVDFNETPYPVDLVSCEFENESGFISNSRIKFNLYGQAVCGNTVITPLVSGQIVVSSGGFQETVIIDVATGKASVQ